MYTGLLHTHRLAVILFLLLYLVKGGLLIFNQQAALEKLTKASRIPEVIISFLFLATGVWMMFLIAEIDALLWTKVGVVLASIPIAVIGFRRSNKLLAAISVLLIVGAYGLGEVHKVGGNEEKLAEELITDPSHESYDRIAHGAALYTRNCVVCHGEEGNIQKSGAKNLQMTKLSNEEMYKLILNGKNSMPAYEAVPGYDKAGIEAVIAYINEKIKQE